MFFIYRRNAIFILAAITLLATLQGCSTLQPTHPLPANLEAKVEMPGFTNIRAWGDAYSPTLVKSAQESINQERTANHGKLLPSANALALSGGGQDGAFGAGLLCGWSKAGNREQFKLVTGISTGALMAPFIFLGPRYDPVLRQVYTNTSDNDIYKPYSVIRILLSFAHLTSVPSLADNKP